MLKKIHEDLCVFIILTNVLENSPEMSILKAVCCKFFKESKTVYLPIQSISLKTLSNLLIYYFKMYKCKKRPKLLSL